MKFYAGSPYEGLMQFSTAVAEAPFAAELLRQLEDRYDDIDTAIYDLTDGLIELGFEIDEEDVVALLTGEAGPTDELLDVLADNFYEEGEEADLERLYESAILDEELNDEPDEEDEEYEEYDDEDDYEDEDDMETEELYYDDEYEYDEEPAQFSSYFAAVEEMAERQNIQDGLEYLMGRAADMVENGTIPPVAFSIMFGENGGSNQLMQFSAVCEERQITTDEHLAALEYSLDVLAALGGMMNFSQYVDEDPEEYYSDEEMQFSQDAQTIAAASFEAYRSENPL